MRTIEEQSREILDSLMWDEKIDASDIDIRISNGVIELVGSVPTVEQRNLASQIAWSLEEVTEVNNLLQIRLGGDEAEPISDEEINSELSSNLLTNPLITTDEIEVMVEDGVVTLQGSVKEYSEKVRAEQEAEKIVGVTDVRNELTVVPNESINDQKIADRIVAVLQESRHIQPEKIDIKVENGNVILEGEVENYILWSVVADAAIYTEGVVSVENRVTIMHPEEDLPPYLPTM